ncbi:MAG: hypothetical protein QGH60_24275, partial [Phycisphaerae bacterium]|nr:hypothetical protein [Phycisphaerae bacterium]
VDGVFHASVLGAQRLERSGIIMKIADTLRDVFQYCIGLDLPGGLQTVHFGQLDVHEDIDPSPSQSSVPLFL